MLGLGVFVGVMVLTGLAGRNVLLTVLYVSPLVAFVVWLALRGRGRSG